MGNQVRTVILLAGMTVFLIFIGGLIGGRQGMLIAFFLAAAMNFFSYWYSDKMVLKMYRAKEITTQQAPEIYAIVSDLTRQAGLPMPKIYLIPQQAPNAFATGRNPEHAVVAVTEGLVRLMDRDEIQGVLAHELAHVKNRDILIGSVAATMAGAVMMLASMARWSAIFGGGRGGDGNRGGMGAIGLIIMSILAPLGAMLIQMAISRSREYLADSRGAAFAGNSEGLASALEKLGSYSKKIPMQANPQTAHMFIVNPLSGGAMMSLFSTHPPLDERIARLRGYRGGGRQAETPQAERTIAQRGSDFWENLR